MMNSKTSESSSFHCRGVWITHYWCTGQPAPEYRSVLNAGMFFLFLELNWEYHLFTGLMIFDLRFALPADFSSRFAYYRCTLLFSGAHLQNTVRFNWIYLHRCQFFHRCYFVIPVPNFSANDFVKKKWFFIPINLNNDNKISVLTVPVSGIFIAEMK